jgi:acetylornithine deacetylase/succinyl-diaminopimelate desuccinylase-like protein
LVRIRSPLWHESEIAQYLADLMQGIGLEVRLEEVPLGERGFSHQAVGRWRGTGPGPKILLCGHIDTFGSGEEIYRPDLWSVAPYGGDLDDEWLYGLGSLNMKSGVAAMICAVEALQQSGFEPLGEVVLGCVMGETGGGVGIRHLLDHESAFTAAIVAEPTNLSVANISVGYVQGWIRIWGELRHSEPYANPIQAMARVIDVLGPSYRPLTPDGWVSFEPNPDLPGFPRLAARKIESGHDYCALFFDMRTVPGQTDDSVRADLQKLLAKLNLVSEGFTTEVIIPASLETPNFPAMPPTPVDHPIVQELVRAHTRIWGVPPTIGAGDRIGLAADSSHLKKAGIPTVEYGPGSHPVWPMVDERIRQDDIVAATRVLAEALKQLLRQ